MISMMRKEACSGSIADLAHVSSQNCLSDCLTKASANPDNLIDAVRTGLFPAVDQHPNFRSLMHHKAYLVAWLKCFSVTDVQVSYFLGDDVSDSKFGNKKRAFSNLQKIRSAVPADPTRTSYENLFCARNRSARAVAAIFHSQPQ